MKGNNMTTYVEVDYTEENIGQVRDWLTGLQNPTDVPYAFILNKTDFPSGNARRLAFFTAEAEAEGSIVTVKGTNLYGDDIEEVFEANTSKGSTLIGELFFKTVTSVVATGPNEGASWNNFVGVGMSNYASKVIGGGQERALKAYAFDGPSRRIEFHDAYSGPISDNSLKFVSPLNGSGALHKIPCSGTLFVTGLTIVYEADVLARLRIYYI